MRLERGERSRCKVYSGDPVAVARSFVEQGATWLHVVDLSAALEEDDEDWYKFDDDKVSIFPAEKLETLSGGGQDASAYVLLYRARPLV